MNDVVHLDVRSFFSLKDGAFSPEELALRAAQLGMPAVAMTDRDGLYGAARFVSACNQAGVRPILGATLTIRGSNVFQLHIQIPGADLIVEGVVRQDGANTADAKCLVHGMVIRA